ncbi:MAG: hypothetical protein U1F25_15055 [Rubrivivax sp.]
MRTRWSPRPSVSSAAEAAPRGRQRFLQRRGLAGLCRDEAAEHEAQRMLVIDARAARWLAYSTCASASTSSMPLPVRQ